VPLPHLRKNSLFGTDGSIRGPAGRAVISRGVSVPIGGERGRV
jgi:hypothetical protein